MSSHLVDMIHGADEMVADTREELNRWEHDEAALIDLLERWMELLGEDPYEADRREGRT